ncbi:MAG: ATP-binding cassette domain-containing protein [Pseudomonadota bacterium]|nr:ATP-binding cassette domain-containing protein [Pseudomonadota bacterium]
MQPKLPILQAQGLCFSHHPAPAPRLFDELAIALPPGVSWLGGDESSGKTTLLQLLAGALLPASGQLQVQGISLAQDRPAYRERVAWLDPRDSALDAQTCRQIFADLPRHHPAFDPEALQQHINGLSLAPHLDKRLSMLSTGTRRKVLIAAVLAAQAPVTLLDQPFMALDRPSIAYLLDFLAAAAQHPHRAWLVADYEAPEGVALATVIALGALIR